MEKLLSVAIPTYNMEKYLYRCLDSFLIKDCELLKQLEVIVVNDGSKDSSSVIAHEYQNKYPDTFCVIDKENGHYGSCINAALKIATGKYFRIVDSDDWVDTNSLYFLMSELANREEDCIFTRFTICDENKNENIEQNISGLLWGKTLDLHKFEMPLNGIAMHNLTYKRALLRAIDYKQTTGICYTDTEYVYYPFSQADTLYCYDMSLYQYYIGRGEQSMNPATQVKNFSHFQKLFDVFANYKINESNCNQQSIYRHFLQLFVTSMLQVHLLFEEKYDAKRDEYIRSVMAKLKREEPMVYNSLLNVNTHGIPYIRIWILNPFLGRFMHSMLVTINRLRK